MVTGLDYQGTLAGIDSKQGMVFLFSEESLL